MAGCKRVSKVGSRTGALPFPRAVRFCRGEQPACPLTTGQAGCSPLQNAVAGCDSGNAPLTNSAVTASLAAAIVAWQPQRRGRASAAAEDSFGVPVQILEYQAVRTMHLDVPPPRNAWHG